MHNKRKPSQFISGILATALIALPLTALAKDINLYDSPNANAKVIGKIDIAAGVVPIYTPKPGDWMKVGDPRNGNTGWIKSSEIKQANGADASISFSQQIINDGNGPHTYSLLQFGQPQMTQEQQKQYMKQIQARQQAIQAEIQHEIEDMNRHFNSMQQGWPFFNDHFPMIMPVVFVPVQNQPAKQPNKPVSTTPPSKPSEQTKS